VLHTAAYAALGLTDWTYTAIECDEAGLPDLLASCDRQVGGAAADHATEAPVPPIFYAERARRPRPGPSAVLEVVYDPCPPRSRKTAAKSGAIVVSGFDLLLHQAARQVEMMTSIKPAPWTRCAPRAKPS
jgi:shikimate 5-dehydrogenase